MVSRDSGRGWRDVSRDSGRSRDGDGHGGSLGLLREHSVGRLEGDRRIGMFQELSSVLGP